MISNQFLEAMIFFLISCCLLVQCDILDANIASRIFCSTRFILYYISNTLIVTMKEHHTNIDFCTGCSWRSITIKEKPSTISILPKLLLLSNKSKMASGVFFPNLLSSKIQNQKEK